MVQRHKLKIAHTTKEFVDDGKKLQRGVIKSEMFIITTMIFLKISRIRFSKGAFADLYILVGTKYKNT